MDYSSCCSFTLLKAVFAAFAISVLSAGFQDWAVIGSALQLRPAHFVTSTVPVCCYLCEDFCFVGVCLVDVADQEARPFAFLTLHLCYDLCAYACFYRRRVLAVDQSSTANSLVRELCLTVHFRVVTLNFDYHKSRP